MKLLRNAGKVCKHEPCERPAKKKLLCTIHYVRSSKNAPLDAPVRHRNKGKICAVDVCLKEARSKGYCETHYARSVKGADLMSPLKVKAYNGATCNVEGCERKAKSLKMCRAHYERKWSGSKLTVEPFQRTYKGEECENDGCSLPAESLGHCRYHYSVIRKYGKKSLQLVDDYMRDGCPLCRRSQNEAGAPYVDHDHSCCAGQKTCGACVRGAICSRCNAALGMFQDSVEVLKRAVRYVQGNHPAASLKEAS